MDKDNKLVSLKINGSEIDPNKEYRIATLDYVVEGNDRMTAFKSKTKVNGPKGTENNVRFIIISYFKEMTAQGKVVDSKVENRFVKTK